MSLAELAEKGADTDLLRDMIQFVAQRMMEMDAEGLCAAAYGERSAERANSRNGYRDRLWETMHGRMATSLEYGEQELSKTPDYGMVSAMVAGMIREALRELQD